MNRRNFIISMLQVWAISSIIGCAEPGSYIIQWTKKEVDAIINKPINTKINTSPQIWIQNKGIEISQEDITQISIISIEKCYDESLLLIWKNEISFFMKFFHIQTWDKKSFVDLIKNIQSKYTFKPSWILWDKLLEKIYLEYYSKAPDQLNQEQTKRLEIYQEMLWYRNIKWSLHSELDIFNMNDYYGNNLWVNKEGTLINENIINKIPYSLNDKKNKIIISQLRWKNILSFYVKWDLYLATYVSPWSLWHKTPKLYTTGKTHPDKYHISSEYPKKTHWWAIMPYAVHIDGRVWIHGSPSTINGKWASHGCIRVPLFYIKEIYEKVKKIWKGNVIIDTRQVS
jgi:hypothetical protein